MSPLKVGDSTVYKGKSGQWSFVAHRASGILVFFFLLLHIVDVSLINFRGGDLYNEVHELYGNILLRIFECGLLFALLVMYGGGHLVKDPSRVYGLLVTVIGGGGAILLYAACARKLRIAEFGFLLGTVTAKFGGQIRRQRSRRH